MTFGHRGRCHPPDAHKTYTRVDYIRLLKQRIVHCKWQLRLAPSLIVAAYFCWCPVGQGRLGRVTRGGRGKTSGCRRCRGQRATTAGALATQRVGLADANAVIGFNRIVHRWLSPLRCLIALNISRRSIAEASPHPAISSRLRQHPWQKPLVESITQRFVHGEATESLNIASAMSRLGSGLAAGVMHQTSQFGLRFSR